jgi:mono/diheme cytochrome c family protein
MNQLKACLLIAWVFAAAQVAAQPNEQRGELLYAKHCIACHTTQIHWRDKKLVTDWASLTAEIRRFEGIAQLGWSDADVADVARYLNTLYYHFPPGDRVGSSQ